jgi:hypothetical protein
MSWRLAFGAAGALLLGTVAAQASDATLLGEHAGFLVGSAHRCGIEAARVERAAALSNELIAAFSTDDDDKEAARTHFTEHVLASALAKLLGDPTPSCVLVRAQLAELEQHSPATTTRPEAVASAKTGKPGIAATTKRENLVAERRAITLKRAAERVR